MDEMPPFPEKGSRLLEKLKKKDPKQARIHEDKPTGVDDMAEAKIPDLSNPVVPMAESKACTHTRTHTHNTNTTHVHAHARTTHAQHAHTHTVALFSPNNSFLPPPVNAVEDGNPVSEVLVDLFGGTVDGPGVLPNDVSVDGLDNLTSGWEVNFRQLMVKNSGVLYEDDLIQIGVKSEYKGNLGELVMLF